MSVFFNVRPPKTIVKRVLLDGDKAVATPAWGAVASTKQKFNVGKDSLVELKVEGTVIPGATFLVAVDIAIDGKLIGFDALPAGPVGPNGATNGLKTMKSGAAANNFAFNLCEYKDDLAEGEHTIEIYALSTGAGGLISAATASSPLKINVVEHPSTYPPSSVTG